MDQHLPEILYEDSFILAINKPAGLLSIRDGYNSSLPHVRQMLEPQFGRLWIVHRLDRDTSGVFLLARTSEYHRALNLAFEKHEVQKVYHAIVAGAPAWNEQQVDLPLKVNGDRNHRTIVDQVHGKPAQTSLRVLKSNGQFTLIEARPSTGYTHQIRSHLLAAGFPIHADPLYFVRSPQLPASGLAALSISRLALHAFSITFAHPETGLSMTVVAPYPGDFAAAVDALSQSS